MHTSIISAVRYIIHDSDAKVFEVYCFDARNKKWKVYKVSEDSDMLDSKEPDFVKIPKGIYSESLGLEMFRRSAGIIGFMIGQAAKN